MANELVSNVQRSNSRFRDPWPVTRGPSLVSHESRVTSHEPRASSLVKRAQVTIELVLGFIATITFFVGILIVWSWLVGALVKCQQNYDASRVEAANPTPSTAGKLSEPPSKLSVWGN